MQVKSSEKRPDIKSRPTEGRLFSFQAVQPIEPGRSSGTLKVKRSAVCVVQTRPDGTITVDKEPATLPDLRRIVETKLAENENLIVVIETHPRSEYGLMVDVLDEVRLADARRISLRSLEAEE